MRKILFLCLFALVGFLPEARGQTIPVTTLTAQGSTCVAPITAGSALVLALRPEVGAAAFTINTNAGGNTMSFFASGDGGKTYSALSVTPTNSTTTVTTATGTGTWRASVAGYTNVCMLMSTQSSGNTLVNINPSTASALGIGGGGGGPGTVNSGTAGQLTYYATTGTAVSGNSHLTYNTTVGGSPSILNVLMSDASPWSWTIQDSAAPAGSYTAGYLDGNGTFSISNFPSGSISGTIQLPSTGGAAISSSTGTFTVTNTAATSTVPVIAPSFGGTTTVDCAGPSVTQGSDDSVTIQNCLAYLKTLSTQAGIADARHLTKNVWSINPFTPYTAIPNSGTLLLPPGNITVSNVPILLANNWSLTGVCSNSNSGTNTTGTVNATCTTFVAGASFPPTYQTGTVTMSTRAATVPASTNGVNMVVTGSGTSWVNNSAGSGNIAIGCGFVSPISNVTDSVSTYGVITAITSGTSITLGSGVNGFTESGGSGAANGSTYVIYCPVLQMGSGGVEANTAYEYGMGITNVAFDANNITGVVPVMNWFCGQNCFLQNVSGVNFNSFGLDVEGNYTEESGPYNNLQFYPGTSSVANTVPIFMAYAGGTFGLNGVTVRGGPGGTKPAAGIVLDVQGGSYENLDTEGFATGIAINKNLTCSPSCPFSSSGGMFNLGPAGSMNIDSTTGSGTTAIHLYSSNGGTVLTSIRNVSSTVFTNLLIDDVNHCTLVVGSPDYHIGEYVLDGRGYIGYSTTNAAGCTAFSQGTQCNFALTTSTFTLALSPVSLCTMTLPSAAVVWRVNCQAGYSVTAGTTPTFAVGNKWSQTPSGVFGAANIDTTNAGVGVQGTTSSTATGNILATGTLTTSATIFTTNWWTTFTGSATAGTYNPTASLTGTSALGTLVGFCTAQ